MQVGLTEAVYFYISSSVRKTKYNLFKPAKMTTYDILY